MLLSALAAGLVLTVPGTYNGNGQSVDYVHYRGSGIHVENYRVTGYGPNVACVAFLSGNGNSFKNSIVEHCGATGIACFVGKDHVVEGNVVRDPKRGSYRGDMFSIFNDRCVNFLVQDNTGLGSGFGNNPNVISSTTLLNNHFYIPEDYRTDCKGNIQRDGPCNCGEFGIALKGGHVYAGYNDISGYRQSDPICGGSGAPGTGMTTAACGHGIGETCPTTDVIFYRNKVSDSRYGIYSGPTTSNFVAEENLLCDNDVGIQDGFSNLGSILNNHYFGNIIDEKIYGGHVGPVTGNHRVSVCQ